MSRPSDYSGDIAADVCARLASGESLVKICRDEGMPGLRTIYNWLGKSDEFRHMYARAREDQADTLADEILDIADEDPATVLDAGEDGGLRVDGALIQHQRLRVDARKWVASKLKPRKYGDSSAISLSNPDGTGILSGITVSFIGSNGTVPGEA